MKRRIFLDCKTEMDGDIFPDMGERAYIRANPYNITFSTTLFVDGMACVVKEFKSRFRDFDMEDEEHLANVIFKNLYAMRPEMYDVHNPPEQPGDELIVEFSPYAKGWFDFLKRYNRKLLDMFNPQISKA